MLVLHLPRVLLDTALDVQSPPLPSTSTSENQEMKGRSTDHLTTLLCPATISLLNEMILSQTPNIMLILMVAVLRTPLKSHADKLVSSGPHASSLMKWVTEREREREREN